MRTLTALTYKGASFLRTFNRALAWTILLRSRALVRISYASLSVENGYKIISCRSVEPLLAPVLQRVVMSLKNTMNVGVVNDGFEYAIKSSRYGIRVWF